MRVLVTGANGFIGSALCPYLAAQGYEVIPVVRRTSGIINEKIVLGDIGWKEALKGCDSVIHLAGRTNNLSNSEFGELNLFRLDNVEATINIAKYAANAGVRRFVFLSTIKVNGEVTAPNSSFRPDDHACPKGSYAISKWEAEQELLKIAQMFGLEVVIIRPPLVYGPGVKGNFATLIKLVKRGLPLPLGGTCNVRSMIALDNLLSLISHCANSKASPNADGQILLVSDGEDISTQELLRRVAKAYDCKVRLFSMPIRLFIFVAGLVGKTSFVGRIFGSLVIDGSKCRQLLGWHPPSTMEDQLKKMASYDANF